MKKLILLFDVRYMKNFNVLCLVFSLLSFCSFSQHTIEYKEFKGKVTNRVLNTPIKASLFLESLPYGGDNRVFSTNDSSGTFSYDIDENKEYRIKVTAKGYLSIEDTLKSSMLTDSVYYSLMPSGSGAVLRLNLNFQQSKATILESSYEELNQLERMLREYPNMEIQLEGHTDYRGSESANLRLSQRRVRQVKLYLTGKGIESKRIQTKAFGGSQPLTRKNTEEARVKNRRVEVRILKTE